MSNLVAALDACVLVPAALRDTLLRAAQEGLYKPLWSETILTELSRTLINQGMTDAPRAAHLLTTLRSFFPDSTVRGFESHIEQMTNHPKDRHVLATAVVGGATILVTSNLRDFPAAAAEPWDIEIQSPDEFLCNLFALDPIFSAKLSGGKVPISIHHVRYRQSWSVSQDRQLPPLLPESPPISDSPESERHYLQPPIA